MVDDIAVQEFIKAIKEPPTDTNTVYSATVSRVDTDGTVWVNIHGSDMETPTASTSAEVQRGDAVTVQWRNNKLYIGGNYSNPSAGVVRVANVEANAFAAFNAAENAWQFASDANALANNAMVSANGKNSIYYTATAPTGGTYKIGDTWFNSSEDNAIYTWDGTAWTKEELGEDAIANLSITNAKIADATIQNGKIANLDAAKITTGTLAAARIGAGSITIGKFDSTTQEQVLNSNVQVGGRNLFRNSMFLATNTTSGVTYTHSSDSEYVSISGTATEAIDKTIADLTALTVTNTTVTISTNSVFTDSATTYFYVSTTKNDAWYKNYEKIAWYSSTERRLTITLENGETLRYLRVKAPSGATFNGSFRFKIEIGNKQTDWTPAPEDVEDYTDEVAATLSDSFNGSLAETANELSGSIDDIRTLANSKADATALSNLSTQMQEYIGEGGYIYANNGTLIIATGRDIGNFKIGIDGTQIVFYQNDNAVAYINNNRMYISRSEVTDEQKISNFAFKKRDDGRFTLMYVGG